MHVSLIGPAVEKYQHGVLAVTADGLLKKSRVHFGVEVQKRRNLVLKHLLLTAMVVTLAANLGYADQSRSKVTIQVDKVTPTNGRQMYSNYCAPCHGMDGRGHGAVAGALKTPPTDLTVLSRQNRGKYPDAHIVAVLQGGAEIQGHQTAEMPVWGPILGKMNKTTPEERLLRICNLSRYLDTIQTK
jgi:mono/diheme cytochrome c family protein